MAEVPSGRYYLDMMELTFGPRWDAKCHCRPVTRHKIAATGACMPSPEGGMCGTAARCVGFRKPQTND